MTRVNNSVNCIRSGAISAAVLAESCHIVLETSPPDYVQKISRYLESSVGQNKRDEASNAPAEAESDSGDSLFITQKSVPEAERSRRRLPYSSRSKHISPRDLEEREEDDDSSSASSDGEPTAYQERRISRTYLLPTYSFPFLSEQNRQFRRNLFPECIKNLHNYAMGGFFKCVGELRQHCERGKGLKSSLPTMDEDGQDISPLSEEDKEESEDENIKVVARKRFVFPSKAKSQQTWFNQSKQPRQTMASDAKKETTGGRQTIHKMQVKPSILKVTPLSSDTDSSDNGESSGSVLVQRKSKNATRQRNALATTETQKPKKGSNCDENVFILQKASDEGLCKNNDAAVSKPQKLQRSSRQPTGTGRAAFTPVEAQVGKLSGSQRVLCSPPDIQAKRKKKGKVVPGGLRAASSINMEVEVTPSLFEDHRAEPPAGQTSDQLGIYGQNGLEDSPHGIDILRLEQGDIPDAKQKKKRRKKKEKEEPEGLHAATSINVEAEETPSLFEDHRAEPPAGQTSDQLAIHGQNGLEDSSCGGQILRLEEGDIPDAKQKKKKEKEKPEGLHAATPINVEAEETPSLFEDHRAEPPAGQTSDQLGIHGQNGLEDSPHGIDILRLQQGDIPDAKQKKKRRKKKEKEQPECLRAATSINMEAEETPSQFEDHRAEPPAGQTSDQLGIYGQNGLEDSPCGGQILRLEEGDIPEAGRKKKKRKKNKSAAENVGQEVDGNLKSDVIAEDSGLSVSCNGEDGGKKKKKRRSTAEVEQLQFDTVPEPANDDAVIQKKKKKRKKEEKRTLDLTAVSAETLEESRNCLGNVAASQGTESKRKKHKKKSSSYDASGDEVGVDASFGPDDSVTMAKGAGMSLKKKKGKTLFEMFNVFQEENETVEIVDNQRTKEGPEDQNAEPVTKKKKKKKKEKETERTSSFLAADAEEHDAQTHVEQNSPSQSDIWGAEKLGVSAGLEELNDSVKKTKKKRKISVAQDGVEKDHEQDFKERNESQTGMKRKRKRTGSESESVTPMEGAADAGLSPTDEGVALKKKKKKCKGRTMSMVEHASASSESSETPGNQVLNEMRDEKKKKKMKSTDHVLLDCNPLTECAESEPRKKKKKQKKERNEQSCVPSIIISSPILPETSLSKCEMSPSGNVMKNKHKRRLLNPSENFLSDW